MPLITQDNCDTGQFVSKEGLYPSPFKLWLCCCHSLLTYSMYAPLSMSHAPRQHLEIRRVYKNFKKSVNLVLLVLIRNLRSLFDEFLLFR